jgi:hypothetical protein
LFFGFGQRRRKFLDFFFSGLDLTLFGLQLTEQLLLFPLMLFDLSIDSL